MSIYKNAFDINSIVWSNDQNDLIKYISIYLNLMEFWKSKMSDFIYDLNYEKLIDNKTEEIKKLIEGMKIADTQIRMQEDNLKLLTIARQSMGIKIKEALKNIEPLN